MPRRVHIILILLTTLCPCLLGKHLHLEFPYETPFPLPPAEALAFLATPTSWLALSNTAFQIGKMITPAFNATANSFCDEDINKPSTCGWSVSYQGQVVENFTHFEYNPANVNDSLNFTVQLPFNGAPVTEKNTFWCVERYGNCELHRTIVADLDGDADMLQNYTSALYFQGSKELLQWIAIAGRWAVTT